MAIKKFKVNGELLSIAQIAMKANCSTQCIYHRLRTGKTPEGAMKAGPSAKQEKTIKTIWGFDATYRECAKILGDVTTSTFRTRVNRWGVDDPRTWQSSKEISATAARARKESNKKTFGNNRPNWGDIGSGNSSREERAAREIPVGTWESSL